MTKSEVLLWNELKNKQILGYDFDRQKRLDQFIVDFYCKELQLAIEIDGRTHEFEETRINDKDRQTVLEKLGVKFLRFNDYEVIHNRENVLLEIEGWIVEYEQNIDYNL